MILSDKTTIERHGLRAVVTIYDTRFPWPVRLVFAPSDDPDAPLVGFEVPVSSDERRNERAAQALDIAELERVAANLDTFVEYARAALVAEGPKGIESPHLAAIARMLDAHLGRRTGGLPDLFYELVAVEYDRMRTEGASHPGKALAERFGVDKSTASRWIAGARARGHIKEGHHHG